MGTWGLGLYYSNMIIGRINPLLLLLRATDGIYTDLLDVDASELQQALETDGSYI